MPITGTIPVTATLAPTSELDTYPVTNPKFGLGGLRTVQDITARNNIYMPLREKGMVVYVVSDGVSGQYYTLIGGTSNSDWYVFSGVGGGGGAGARGETGPTGPTGPVGDYVISVNGITGSVAGVVRFTSSTTPPTTGITAGHKWFDETSGTEFTYIWDGNTYQWVDIAGGGSKIQPKVVVIESISTDIPSLLVKGSSNYSLGGKGITVTYAYGGGIAPATACVYPTNPSNGTGFPAYFATGAMNRVNFSGQTLTAGIGESITLRIHVTGQDGSYDIYDYPIGMENVLIWGGTTHTFLTGNDLSVRLQNTGVVGNLNQSFSITANYQEYIYYSHPERKGKSRHSLNKGAFGGMALQGEYTITGSGTGHFVNSLGYGETYYIYRSIRANLGQTLVEISGVS